MKNLCFSISMVVFFTEILGAKVGTVTKKPAIRQNTTQTSVTIAPIASTTQGFFKIRLPCTCAGGQCGCCTGMMLERLRQKVCMNLTYEPEDFALTAIFNLNGRNLYKNTLSGKNPPPICVNPPNFSFIKMCIEFFNLYFANRNIHVCMKMMANWQSFTLLSFSFDCVRLGAGGVAVVGPEDGGGIPGNPLDSEDQTDEDYDDSARDVLKLPSVEKQKQKPPENMSPPADGPINVERLINGDFLITFRKGFHPRGGLKSQPNPHTNLLN